uniref:Uncharacterized protein n=1 Tax=Aliivibrio wodanis TaxID=80852 RepID=A0A5Q4ZTI1_9GAMM|nr:hypothetical protein AW0309160_01862 [Aliivibrio wodanis]
MIFVNNLENIDIASQNINKLTLEFKKYFIDDESSDSKTYLENINTSLNKLKSKRSNHFLLLVDIRNDIQDLIKFTKKITISNVRLRLKIGLEQLSDRVLLAKKNQRYFSFILKKIKQDIESLRDDYIITLKEILSDSISENSKLKGTLVNFEIKLPEIEKKLDLKEQDIRTLLDESLLTFSSKVESLDKEIEQSFRRGKESLLKAEKDSYNKLLSSSSEYNIRLQKEASSLKDDLNNFINKQIDDSREEINYLKNKIDEDHLAFKSIYENMVGLYVEAGNERLAKHNLEQAQIEKESADNMRSMGIGLLFVLIGFAAWFLVLLAQLPAEVNYLSWFIPRFLTLTFCSTPAIYLLKESASHRHKENLYRQRGTQLATIDAYLADFDDTNKVGVKSDLAKNFYTVHNGKADTSNVPDFIKQMKEFAAVTKTFNKIAPVEQAQHQQTPSTPVTPIHEASNTEKKQQA